MKRIYSIDFARGVVMVIMALDHVRDLMHTQSISQRPTNMDTTTPVLFFTRWITHLCAPAFVFLAGVSVYLSFKRRPDFSQNRKFLIKRGLWLILLEFTVVNFGITFDAGFHILFFEVIAATGLGFIVLALLLRLGAKAIGIAGLAIILLHDIIFLIAGGQGKGVMSVMMPFFSQAAFPLFPNHMFIIAYPPIPWLGVMMAGFGAGKFFELPESRRSALFLKIGMAALLFFIALRLINIYGDPVPWSVQKNSVYTFLSFMNVSKYPPSLLFCSATLGILFLMLAVGERIRNRVTDIARVYGKVPLFYFIIHFYLIHLLLIMILLLQGYHWADLEFTSGTYGRPKGAGGIPLGAVYLAWIIVVAVLYEPCAWFGRYKDGHQKWWLKYI